MTSVGSLVGLNSSCTSVSGKWDISCEQTFTAFSLNSGDGGGFSVHVHLCSTVQRLLILSFFKNEGDIPVTQEVSVVTADLLNPSG